MRRPTRDSLITAGGALGAWSLAALSPLAHALPLERTAARLTLLVAGLVATVGAWLVWRLPPRGKRLGLALLLVAGSFTFYLSNGRALTGGDNHPARELAARLLDGRGLHYAELDRQESLPYWLVDGKTGVHSAFPLGTGLATVPFGALARVVASQLLEPERLPVFEKLTAAALTSLAVGLFFLVLAHRFGTRTATLPALALAVATPLVTTQSQGLWSATGATLAVVLLLGSVLRRPGARNLPPGAQAALATCGLFLSRPSDLGSSLVALARAGSWRARAGVALALGLGVAGAMAINGLVVGSPLGGYGQLNRSQVGFDPTGMPAGLAGLLVSPSRGLLLFLPWLLLSVPIFARERRLPAPLRATALLALAATLLLCASYGKWWGGYGFGPRLLAGLSPLLALTLLPMGWRRLRRRARRRAWSCALALGLAAGIQFLGMQRAVAWAWNDVVDPDRMPELLWDARNSQLAATLRPQWRFAPQPYAPSTSRETRPSPRRRPLDLAPFANARYDGELFADLPNAEWTAAFPRLDAELLNRPGALFEFLPAGQSNAVVLCDGSEPVHIAVDPPRRVRRVQLVASVLASAPATGAIETGTPVVLVRIQPVGAAEPALHLLRYDERLTPYDPNARSRWPPPSRTYAGKPYQRDALVRIELPTQAYGRDIEAIEFAPALPGATAACTAILAVTLESP